jgi:hypothetical protein
VTSFKKKPATSQGVFLRGLPRGFLPGAGGLLALAFAAAALASLVTLPNI